MFIWMKSLWVLLSVSTSHHITSLYLIALHFIIALHCIRYLQVCVCNLCNCFNVELLYSHCSVKVFVFFITTATLINDTTSSMNGRRNSSKRKWKIKIMIGLSNRFYCEKILWWCRFTITRYQARIKQEKNTFTVGIIIGIASWRTLLRLASVCDVFI